MSEFVGLTINDIDYTEMRINVTHQLQRKRNMEYIIKNTKASSCTRDVPMTSEVAECFHRIIDKRKKAKMDRLSKAQ
ncbi:hypothetical protein [Lachnospira multipara]|uniref:hypothetical protein n=1 Tax=Lachnospira multipara TaxID=28051 RepID=UPI002418A8AF